MLVTPLFMFVSMFVRSAKPFSVVPVIYRKCIALLKYRRSETALPIKTRSTKLQETFISEKLPPLSLIFNFMQDTCNSAAYMNKKWKHNIFKCVHKSQK